MTFATLATYFKKLENTASRNAMTEVLAEIFSQITPKDIDKVCYLLQGRVAPLFEPLEFGVADKLMMRSISQALDINLKDVLKEFKKLGDLGEAAEKLKKEVKEHKIARQTSLFTDSNIENKDLSIPYVFENFKKICQSRGDGSQEEKTQILSQIIRTAEPLSVRYLVRILLGKLRLGFSDMTVLDAFSWMLVKDKSLKNILEIAYNVRSDLGFIGKLVKEKGAEGFKNIAPKIGIPVRMARANRLNQASEILEKTDNKCAVEYKYDGLRVQVHYKNGKYNLRHPERVSGSINKMPKPIRHDENGNFIRLFSRNLEEMTDMFPDIVEAVNKQIMADECIFEGEIVAYNPKNNVYVPFQETMQRKRKYDIAEKALEIPVKLFAFELLYLNGKNYLGSPYIARKNALQKIIQKDDLIIYAQESQVTKEAEIDKLFKDAVNKHFEGIIAKKLDGLYEAGIRGWNWIKYKKAMNRKLADTLDVLVMGYTKGEGKRMDFGVGQFLTGVYDQKRDKFTTLTKIGTGLTDEQFREFIKRVRKLEVKEKLVNYDVDKLMTPDVWLKPAMVVEIGCDEITRSPAHTSGRILEPSKSGKSYSVKTAGYSVRFPKLVNFRDDKGVNDVTTVEEVEDLFKKQN